MISNNQVVVLYTCVTEGFYMQKESLEITVVIITVTGILLLLGGGVFTFLCFSRRRYNKHLIERQEWKLQFQQTLFQSQLEIQEQTLQNISQEIHDNIGQVLSLAKLNLGTVDMAKPDKLEQKINDSRGLVAKAIQDLRSLVGGVNTSYITEKGLLRSVEYTLEVMRKPGGLLTRLHVDGTPIKLDTQKELILFRIIQEILNNITRHAGAKTVDISVMYELQRFSISIADNGRGFDITLLDTGNNSTFGSGIRNMQNRAHLIGASFSITSIPENGTTIFISIPLS
jgi:two-component system, NarL family, sensor kinase